jgi:uncharacterized protein (DUF1015 family)
MLRLGPFAALRPLPELVARVSAVPYDVVSRAEAKALAAGEPLSFLHVTRPEIDLPDDVGPHDDRAYAQAATAFKALQGKDALVRETEPSVYVYRQEMNLLGERVGQTGVFACCHVGDYDDNVIKKHELTRKDKEDDRTRHMLAIGAHAGPVFIAYRPEARLTTLLTAAQKATPLYDFTASDGVRHVVWRASDAKTFVDGFAAAPAAYIADGHHRAASASRAAAERRKQGDGENADSQWFPCVLFASSELRVLPYHRVVKALPAGVDVYTLHDKLQTIGKLDHAHGAPASNKLGVYFASHWHTLKLRGTPDPYVDPVRSLAYVQLTERVLGPILGIEDLRTDARIDFVGGIRGTRELEKRVDSGECAVAFAMPPVTVDQVMRVADAGAIMPPKSTWFEPKLRSGLLVHTFA